MRPSGLFRAAVFSVLCILTGVLSLQGTAHAVRVPAGISPAADIITILMLVVPITAAYLVHRFYPD